MLLRLLLLLISPALVAQASAEALGPAGTEVSASVTAPHVVLIVADDLGWGDVGYHDSEIQTPNIDRLARDGVQLDRFYAYPTCTPTRAALLTGRFATSLGIDSPISKATKGGLPLDQVLMPEYFRRGGYRTAMTGKWHLGAQDSAYWPQHRGFDDFYGFLNGGIGYFDHVFSGGVDWQRNGEHLDESGYSTHLISREAVNTIISRDASKPLFLYVPYNAPHTPLQAPAQAVARYQHLADEQRRVYAAMVSEMDSGIGTIIAALEDEGMLHNSLIVFISDNGSQDPAQVPLLLRLLPVMREAAGSNHPLPGAKGLLDEGGIRVPAALWWPGRIEGGGTISSPVSVHDLLPTLAAAAQLDLTGVRLDGENKLPLLAMEPQGRSKPFVLSSFDTDAVIDWPYKLLVIRKLPFLPEMLQRSFSFLYNLEQDPYEQEDLSALLPGQVAKMRDWLGAVERGAAVGRPELIPRGDNMDIFGGEVSRPPWAEAASRANHKPR